MEEDRGNSEWSGEETGQRKCLQVSKFFDNFKLQQNKNAVKEN